MKRDEKALLRGILSVLRESPNLPDGLAEDVPWADPSLEMLLDQHRVRSLWTDAVRPTSLWSQLPETLRRRLEEAQRADAARGLMQQAEARELASTLGKAGVPHLFYKGIYLRSELYSAGHLRPADDIDLLVAPDDLGRSLAALTAAGFERKSPKRRQRETHETGLIRKGVHVDLHWHLFRPGRVKFDPVHDFLGCRKRRRGLHVPSDLHVSVAMTAGPALGDYVTGRLLKLVDLDRWIRAGRVPWNELTAYVRRLGLATAAWATLVWTQRCLGTPIPADSFRALRPSPARQTYLKAWLALDAAAIYRRYPFTARTFFSLALQDSLTDLPRAVAGRLVRS